ncbi:MAG: class I SAM-dependent methyltransferase [Chitinophagaceae bacterium]|nr:MAG: class I SAM-dependent methyltransferase [Chitinophagaceae bacterium]
MEWISILKCPLTGKDLRRLEAADLVSINQKIVGNQLWEADGKIMTTPLSDGLKTVDGSYIYPIVEEIVLLLPDLALVDAKEKVLGDTLSDDKKLVKNFYDSRGWHTTDKGDYEDADIFEDLRPFAQEYLTKCHRRVSRYLNPSGKYMMDAASGALQFEDYLQYSENYDYRICVDLSFQGLKECKRKLGKKAICLLCDMTNLPVKNDMIDGFVSLNTIYHIPKDEQVKAITELYRVTKPAGKGVVVYDWYKHSPWMNVTLLPFRGYEFVRNRLKSFFSRAAGKGEPMKMLYFYAHNYEFFKKNLPMPFKLVCWRSVSVPFMKVYLHEAFSGKKILDKIYEMEEKDPEGCGLKGEYPMFAFEKPTLK